MYINSLFSYVLLVSFCFSVAVFFCCVVCFVGIFDLNLHQSSNSNSCQFYFGEYTSITTWLCIASFLHYCLQFSSVLYQIEFSAKRLIRITFIERTIERRRKKNKEQKKKWTKQCWVDILEFGIGTAIEITIEIEIKSNKWHNLTIKK